MPTHDIIESPDLARKARPVDISSMDSDLSVVIEDLLNTFDGETSLKRLFWEMLSYDRVREPLPMQWVPPTVAGIVIDLEVFASSESLTIIYTTVKRCLDGYGLEQMCWALKRHIFDCVVILRDPSSWTVIYPDEVTKPRLRLLPLPGPPERRSETARALAALNCADEASNFEISDSLDTFFPGVMPNLSDVLQDFERIARHPSGEVRDLLPLIRESSKYPLLTSHQERGDDISTITMAPDGSRLTYQQWRLVIHNLRLVLWMARRFPRMGIDLSDLVEEGILGLMTAARKFDSDRGTRFTTYAYYWVRQKMFRALHNQCNAIRWPVWKAPELISACLKGKTEGLTPGEKPVVNALWDLSLASLKTSDPTDFRAIAEIRSAVDYVLRELKPIERKVISRRFGIGCDSEQTLEEIGHDFGLTRERIRQIEAQALLKLRHPARLKKLRAYAQCSEWRVRCAADRSESVFPSATEVAN